MCRLTEDVYFLSKSNHIMNADLRHGARHALQEDELLEIKGRSLACKRLKQLTLCMVTPALQLGPVRHDMLRRLWSTRSLSQCNVMPTHTGCSGLLESYGSADVCFLFESRVRLLR